jgi:hypothetical protein
VPLALVFANEHGAGLEAATAVRSPFAGPSEAVEMFCGLRIKPADGLLLNVPAEEPCYEILGEGRRWGRPKRSPPQAAKLVKAERPHAFDLGLDHFAIE